MGGACSQAQDALRAQPRFRFRAPPPPGSRGAAVPVATPISSRPGFRRGREAPVPGFPQPRPEQPSEAHAGVARARPAMPRGLRSQLRLRVLLLLLLPPLVDALELHDPAGPREAAEEPGSGQTRPTFLFRDLRKWVRAAGALTRRYWALFSCRVWPETCSLDKEAPAGALGKTRV